MWAMLGLHDLAARKRPPAGYTLRSTRMPDPSTPQLARALRELEPRFTEMLTWHLLRGRAADHCAALYGIREEAFRIHLLRALEALEARMNGRKAPLRTDDEERRIVALIARGGAMEADADARRLSSLAARLAEDGAALEREVRRAQLEEEMSPSRSRQEIIRRVAIAALIVLAAFFYWRNEVRERPKSLPNAPAGPAR